MRRSLISSVVFVVALGACGSTGQEASKVSTLQLVAGSADAAAAAKTGRISGHEILTVKGEAKTIPIEGAIDFTNGSSEMTVDAGSMGLKGFGSIKARVVDRVVYMNFDRLLSGRDVPASLRGKKWIKIDFGTSSASGGSAGSGAAGLLESLRGAGEVRRVGTERIGGVDTDHFHATVHTAKAIAKLKPGPLRDLAEKGIAKMGSSYPVDVWIDHDGLPRRFSVKISSKDFDLSETVDYSDFGTAIHVEKPPADETADFSELLSASKSGASAS